MSAHVLKLNVPFDRLHVRARRHAAVFESSFSQDSICFLGRPLVLLRATIPPNSLMVEAVVGCPDTTRIYKLLFAPSTSSAPQLFSPLFPFLKVVSEMLSKRRFHVSASSSDNTLSRTVAKLELLERKSDVIPGTPCLGMILSSVIGIAKTVEVSVSLLSGS